jgi:hypothetical protein
LLELFESDEGAYIVNREIFFVGIVNLT